MDAHTHTPHTHTQQQSKPSRHTIHPGMRRKKSNTLTICYECDIKFFRKQKSKSNCKGKRAKKEWQIGLQVPRCHPHETVEGDSEVIRDWQKDASAFDVSERASERARESALLCVLSTVSEREKNQGSFQVSLQICRAKMEGGVIEVGES